MYVVAVFLAVAFISHEEVKSMIYLFLKNVCAKGMRNEIYTIWTERDWIVSGFQQPLPKLYIPSNMLTQMNLVLFFWQIGLSRKCRIFQPFCYSIIFLRVLFFIFLWTKQIQNIGVYYILASALKSWWP